MKIKHYVPRQQLIRYYLSNIQPIIQYGLLIYGCTNYSAICIDFSDKVKFLRF